MLRVLSVLAVVGMITFFIFLFLARDESFVREIAQTSAVWQLRDDGNTRVLVTRKNPFRFAAAWVLSEELTREALRGIPVSTESESWLRVPKGYRADIFVGGLARPRVLGWDPVGRLMVSETLERGRLWVYEMDGAGTPRGRLVLDGEKNGASRLLNLHGFTFLGGRLYTASEHALESWEYDAETGRVTDNGRVVSELPSGSGGSAGGGHTTRTLVASQDGFLYLSVGSNCDACTDSDPKRYAVLRRIDLNAGTSEPYATGLRNTVFFIETETPGVFYGNDMGQDDLGEEYPPDELNILCAGAAYGWPLCVADRAPLHDAARASCELTQAPAFSYEAHSAPLGIRAIPSAFRADWEGDLLSALHGSVIRVASVAGYKVVRIILDEKGRAVASEDAITGFIGRDNVPLGRPVDVLFADDGTLYISDDHAGVIHRIRNAD